MATAEEVSARDERKLCHRSIFFCSKVRAWRLCSELTVGSQTELTSVCPPDLSFDRMDHLLGSNWSKIF